MASEALRHRRRSARLVGYDYSWPAAYFVTICTAGRVASLGTIIDGVTQFSAAGEIAAALWREIPDRFLGVDLDEYVVMPNHIHGIVMLGGGRNESPEARDESARGRDESRPYRLGEVIRSFKAVTTRTIRLSGTPDFAWQRNYYEHVTRSRIALDRIREYIASNPARWACDGENPAGVPDSRERNFWQTLGAQSIAPAAR